MQGMGASPLDLLYRLHKIDAEIAQIKSRAKHLGATQKAKAMIAAHKAEYEAALQARDRLKAEIKDLELQQKSLADKIQHLDRTLYGGTVVGTREVEAIQREIKAFGEQKDAAELRQLELMEALPEVENAAKSWETKMATLQAQAKAEYEAALKEKTRLEEDFKTLTANRPKVRAAVDAGLLAQYEAILKRHDGIGMAEVKDNGACGMCGTQLATKILESTVEGKIVSCPECTRLLIQVIPSV